MSIRNKIDAFLTPKSSRKGELLGQSEVFCMSPWIQLHAQTNGKVAPCCMADTYLGDEIGDLKKNPDLSAAWNSENMKKLRQNMLNGKKSIICGNCYKYEELHKFSERMQYNQDFRHYYRRIENTRSDGALLDETVPIIDVRFSNKCNYKCRICNSDYSTLWFEDEVKLGKDLSGKPKEMRAAADELKFWECFKKLLPTVKRLHFAGGEPLFMDEHYRVLEYLVEIGKTDVNLTYNTNLSTLRFKRHYIIDYWKQFKQVDVWASLDGMGKQGDYQRKGQKWAEIESNIRTIQAECPQVSLGVNVTTSILNIFHIPGFYKHLVENKFVKPERVNLYLLLYPKCFALTNLTPGLKSEVMEMYRNFENEFLNKLSDSQKIKEHVQAVLNLMNSMQDELLPAFRATITKVDKIREEDFLATYPELREMFAALDSQELQRTNNSKLKDQKKKEFAGSVEEMRERLFNRIEKYLAISPEMNELERNRKLELYQNAILKIYSLVSSKISEQEFYYNAVNGDIRIMIADLDSYTVEEISQQIWERRIDYEPS